MQVNTFQVVLSTDGEKSFIFFIYADIQWGMGGIGFNAGDGVRSFTVPGSLTLSARVIEEGSNVGVTGVYAFRVDLLDIVRPGGESDCYSYQSQTTTMQEATPSLSGLSLLSRDDLHLGWFFHEGL